MELYSRIRCMSEKYITVLTLLLLTTEITVYFRLLNKIIRKKLKTKKNVFEKTLNVKFQVLKWNFEELKKMFFNF